MILVMFSTTKHFFLCWYETQAKYKNLRFIFTASGIFPRKADSVILLGFECRPTLNPKYLMKIVGAIFEKFGILNFFLM